MSKKIYILIALFLVVVVGAGVFFLTRGDKDLGDEPIEEVLAEDLKIEDYYPKSGPAGSQVFLKFNGSIAKLTDDMEVFYGGEKISIIERAENMIKVVIPKDAASGDIQVKTKDYFTNSVSFSVAEPELKKLSSEKVAPSSQKQTVSYKDEIKVTLPANFLEEEKELTISEMKNAPPNSLTTSEERHVFDVSIEGMDQLDDYIEIGMKYDPSLLDSGKPAEDQLVVMMWDEEENYWVNLPISVDEQTSIVYAITNHLTGLEWLALGAAAIATKPITLLGEKILNDSYITPQGNFKVLYSTDAINEDVVLNDNAWTSITYKDQSYLPNYNSDYPKAVQDVGDLFELAFKNYMDMGFRNPVEKTGFFTGKPYKSPIIVKIDSWWLAVTGEPNYEKVWERIHIPSVRLTESDLMKMTIGHELFHRIQAEYYSIKGFLTPSNGWWLEATAEYAGHNVAWGYRVPGLEEQIGPDYLSYSLTTTGEIKGPGWGEKRYEYVSAIWPRFLVEEKGINFKDLIEYVSEGNPLERTDSFLKTRGGNLASYYQDFAVYSTFDWFKFTDYWPYPFARFEDDTEYVVRSYYPEMYTFSGEAIPTPSYVYDFPEIADRKDILEVPQITPTVVFEAVGGSPGIIVKISNSYGDRMYSTTESFDDRFPDSNEYKIPKPQKISETGYSSPQERVYLFAINGSDKKGSFEVFVNFVNETTGEKKEKVLTHTFKLEPYSAKLWVVKSEVKYPFKIKGTIFSAINNEWTKVVVEGGEFEMVVNEGQEKFYPEITGSANGSFSIYSKCCANPQDCNWSPYEEGLSLTGKIKGNHFFTTEETHFSIYSDEVGGRGFSGTIIDGKAFGEEDWDISFCNNGVPFTPLKWSGEIVE